MFAVLTVHLVDDVYLNATAAESVKVARHINGHATQCLLLKGCIVFDDL